MPTRWQHWTLYVVMVVTAWARVADAQQAPRLGRQPSEEVLQLPEVRVIAPSRLPGLPLPLSDVPATVQVITGAAGGHLPDQLRGGFDVIVRADPRLTAAGRVNEQ